MSKLKDLAAQISGEPKSSLLAQAKASGETEKSSGAEPRVTMVSIPPSKAAARVECAAAVDEFNKRKQEEFPDMPSKLKEFNKPEARAARNAQADRDRAAGKKNPKTTSKESAKDNARKAVTKKTAPAKKADAAKAERVKAKIVDPKRSAEENRVALLFGVANPSKRHFEIFEAAKAGKLPEPPDFSAKTHAYYAKHLVEMIKLVKKGDVKALKAYEPKFATLPYCGSRTPLCRYRDLSIIALEAKKK